MRRKAKEYDPGYTAAAVASEDADVEEAPQPLSPGTIAVGPYSESAKKAESEKRRIGRARAAYCASDASRPPRSVASLAHEYELDPKLVARALDEENWPMRRAEWQKTYAKRLERSLMDNAAKAAAGTGSPLHDALSDKSKHALSMASVIDAALLRRVTELAESDMLSMEELLHLRNVVSMEQNQVVSVYERVITSALAAAGAAKDPDATVRILETFASSTAADKPKTLPVRSKGAPKSAADPTIVDAFSEVPEGDVLSVLGNVRAKLAKLAPEPGDESEADPSDPAAQSLFKKLETIEAGIDSARADLKAANETDEEE